MHSALQQSPQIEPLHDGPRRYLNSLDGCWHIHIVQGDLHVSAHPREIFTTVLGSCIAACIRDPIAGIGGMNHFLLPDADPQSGNSQRYGVHAMEILINALLSHGAARHRLEAKLFGGANVLPTLSGIGSRNADFAHQFLRTEGITVLGGNMGGSLPRKIQYWPHTGRARQRLMSDKDKFSLVQTELRTADQITRAVEGQDNVELF